eukprot:4526254-Pyramimonas_sp.AAC.1
MHRRRGSMRSPTFAALMAAMHRRHRRCIADASPMRRRCVGDVLAMRCDPSTPSTRAPSRRSPQM